MYKILMDDLPPQLMSAIASGAPYLLNMLWNRVKDYKPIQKVR